MKHEMPVGQLEVGAIFQLRTAMGIGRRQRYYEVVRNTTEKVFCYELKVVEKQPLMLHRNSDDEFWIRPERLVFTDDLDEVPL